MKIYVREWEGMFEWESLLVVKTTAYVDKSLLTFDQIDLKSLFYLWIEIWMRVMKTFQDAIRARVHIYFLENTVQLG